jgi:hypothetical protein
MCVRLCGQAREGACRVANPKIIVAWAGVPSAWGLFADTCSVLHTIWASIEGYSVALYVLSAHHTVLLASSLFWNAQYVCAWMRPYLIALSTRRYARSTSEDIVEPQNNVKLHAWLHII